MGDHWNTGIYGVTRTANTQITKLAPTQTTPFELDSTLASWSCISISWTYIPMCNITNQALFSGSPPSTLPPVLGTNVPLRSCWVKTLTLLFLPFSMLEIARTALP